MDQGRRTIDTLSYGFIKILQVLLLALLFGIRIQMMARNVDLILYVKPFRIVPPLLSSDG